MAADNSDGSSKVVPLSIARTERADRLATRRVPRSAAQVRAEIERARAQLSESVSALRTEVVHRTDWRVWVRERPALVLGAAFAIGFWFAYRGDRRH